LRQETQSRANLKGAVDLAPMADLDDENCEAVIIDCVDGPIVPGAKTEILTPALKALDPWRAGVHGKAVNPLLEAPLFEPGKLSELTEGGR